MANTRRLKGTALVCSVLGAVVGLVGLDGCSGVSPVVGEDMAGASAVGGTGGGDALDSGGAGGGSTTGGGDTNVGGSSGRGTAGTDDSGGTGGGSGGSAAGGSGGSASGTDVVEPHVGTAISAYATMRFFADDDPPPNVMCLWPDLRDLRDFHVFRIWAGESCGCDEPGYAEPSEGARRAIDESLANMGLCGGETSCSDSCACEEAPAAGADLEACHGDVPDPAEPAGWCYPTPSDAPNWAVDCSQQHAVRFFGERSNDDLYFVLTNTVMETEVARPALHRPLGAPCVPEVEWNSRYSGSSMTGVELSTNDAACDSSICLLNHFQGRVSCPYGQAMSQIEDGTFGCFLPGSDQPVAVPVEPVRLARPPETSAICSCRCDGTGPGPFCECPSGMECAPLIDAYGLESFAGLDGSYCIPSDTAFNPQAVIPAETCLSERGRSPSPGFPDNSLCDDPLPY